MFVKFDVFFTKNLGTLYKDNSITTLGREAILDLNFDEIVNIHINYKVNNNSFTDLVEIIDISKRTVRIPFKTDVIKEGIHEFELVVTMKNGDVLPSQTYTYKVNKSLENPNAVEADTNYPVLIELMDLAGNKLIDMDKSIQKVNTSIENMTNEISNYKEVTTNALNSDVSSYKETTTKELENNFNNYSSNTTLNINKVLDNKIVEVDNVVSIKSGELDVKFTTKANEITKTLNDEITKVDKTLNSEINKVNTTLTNKVNEVDRVLDTTVTTINAELDKKTKEVDNKVNAKIAEVDNRVNNKINEVDTSLNNKINEVNELIEEVEASEQARKEEHTELVNELSSYSSDMNNVKDRVEVLEAKVTDNEVIVDLKNKVNNHEERISTSEKTIRHQGILLNALNDLDDTISIEEEGSIISLPQSDNGKIIIDELQGNTLINYCTNGSEELTLNNEINVQGTDVTLTDTVDNGKVDVVCEGNTLVNIHPPIIGVAGSLENSSNGIYYLNMHNVSKEQFLSMLKPSTTYTVILDNIVDEVNYILLGGTTIPRTGRATVITTPTSVMQTFLHFYIKNQNLTQEQYDNFKSQMNNAKVKCMVLEGDYTNKPIPSYFEGMKSAFELEENKVEILSNNKNLFNLDNFELDSYGEIKNGIITVKNPRQGAFDSAGVFKLKTPSYFKGKWITLSTNKTQGEGNIEIRQHDINNKQIWVHVSSTSSFKVLDSCEYISLNFNSRATGTTTTWEDIQIEISNSKTPYIEPKSNKIQFSSIEPLRGLPSGVCDKFVKQGGKWYVERNCGEVVLSGSENWRLWSGTSSGNTTLNVVTFAVNSVDNTTIDTDINVISDKVQTHYKSFINGLNSSIILAGNHIHLAIKSNLLSEYSIDGVKYYLQNNPMKVIYQLKTPAYEEIIDLQLITYLDTTHISNNSAIPCNMQIKNSGYNAIIKPSTKYTVAFDTDTSGEVNIGLGGAKTSTTNNVALITTPATLTDDTLRLYGKGMKASNVRLLEGDKTNYIPQYFEGMKSSFEDKLQDDGTYKMEILSNNRNLFRYDSVVKRTLESEVEYGENYVTITDEYYCGNIVKVKPFTDYYIRADRTKYDENSSGHIAIFASDGKKVGGDISITLFGLNNGVFNTKNNNYISVLLYGGRKNRGKTKFSNILLTEFTSETEYIENKQNKIQFSSIEPLRGVGDVKDRFVLKDGKLMIERNCSQSILDRTSSFGYADNSTYSNSVVRFNYNNPLILKGEGVNDDRILCNTLPSMKHSLSGSSKKSIRIHGTSDNIVLLYINKNELSSLDVNGLYEWLAQNPTEIIFASKEPTYEEVPYETQKLILECFENGTLFIDTLIPPTVSVTYSANKPVVAKLNQVDNTTNINTEDIAITQMAVDFLLMSSLGEEMINFKIRGGTNMSAYFASRIIKGALKYEDVINKYPNYKEDIDLILVSEGYSDLIIEL